jgi:hypothetical protein
MLKFKEWEKMTSSVDESIGDDIKNWFSKNFGGRVSKVDSIISDLISIEKKFVSEWESIQIEIGELREKLDSEDLESSEMDLIKGEIKKSLEKIESMERSKTQKIREFNLAVLDLTKGNQRITKYWNLKKAEAEVEISKDLYEISKNLSDPKMEDELYKKHIEALENFRKKEREMDEFVSDKEIDQEEDESPDDDSEIGGEIDIKTKDLISMGTPKFLNTIKRFTSKDIKRVHRELTTQKNLILNDLRALRREKSLEMDKASKKSDKERIMKKYNSRIYELGEIVDGIREKISYINE